MINENGILLVDPGDLWDRITILDIKIIKLEEKLEKLRKTENIKEKVDIEDKLKVTERQYDRARQLADLLIRNTGLIDFITLFRLVSELRDRNEKQWELEDRVRTEISWEAAKAARHNNSKRVEIKNKINKLYGFPTEVKEYAGE